ncbi:MAG: hypothetical protein ACO1N5_13570, partial [Noviherbaspirillum sp.]
AKLDGSSAIWASPDANRDVVIGYVRKKGIERYRPLMTPDNKDADQLDRLLDQLAQHYRQQAPLPAAMERLKALWHDPVPGTPKPEPE